MYFNIWCRLFPSYRPPPPSSKRAVFIFCPKCCAMFRNEWNINFPIFSSILTIWLNFEPTWTTYYINIYYIDILYRTTYYIGEPSHPSGQGAAFDEDVKPIIELLEGSSLLHWAASRGYNEILHYITRGVEVSFSKASQGKISTIYGIYVATLSETVVLINGKRRQFWSLSFVLCFRRYLNRARNETCVRSLGCRSEISSY